MFDVYAIGNSPKLGTGPVFGITLYTLKKKLNGTYERNMNILQEMGNEI